MGPATVFKLLQHEAWEHAHVFFKFGAGCFSSQYRPAAVVFSWFRFVLRPRPGGCAYVDAQVVCRGVFLTRSMGSCLPNLVINIYIYIYIYIYLGSKFLMHFLAQLGYGTTEQHKDDAPRSLSDLTAAADILNDLRLLHGIALPK